MATVVLTQDTTLSSPGKAMVTDVRAETQIMVQTTLPAASPAIANDGMYWRNFHLVAKRSWCVASFTKWVSEDIQWLTLACHLSWGHKGVQNELNTLNVPSAASITAFPVNSSHVSNFSPSQEINSPASWNNPSSSTRSPQILRISSFRSRIMRWSTSVKKWPLWTSCVTRRSWNPDDL